MLYAFSRSYMEAVTDDDNLPGNSHVLTKYIGWEGLELEDVNQIEVDMNQNFLICSDGFYALMEKDVMAYFRVFHFKKRGNIDYDYVKETDSGFVLKRKYEIPFKKSFAFEAKLKNWKRAFIQAYRYKWFAHYSYVIMDEAHAKPAIKQVAHFKNHNVGLLTLSVDGNIEIHYRPKKQPRVDPKMQILLSENILYQ